MKVFHNRLIFKVIILAILGTAIFTGCGNEGKDENQVDEQLEDTSMSTTSHQN